ncbi:arylesterase [Psychrobacter sp. 1U2]|uniref:arylesterase n=1 Tax=Psychrobacter sp. 1U2 TaxID=3453577 RepID=UPI003F4728B0
MKNNNLSLIKRSIFSSTIGILSTALLLSGCQKPAETETTNEPQTTKTTTVTAPVAVEETTSVRAMEQDEKSQPITILALGDSLTEGLGVNPEDNYPAQLEAKLKEMGYENVDVVNSGLSGETSTGLVNRLDWVTQTKPDITILTIGANDAMRGLELETIEENIRTAVKHLQDNGSEVILGGMQIYDNLGNDYVKSFSAIYPRIAEDMNLQMIPFFLEGVGGDPELNQADAIHPTREGYTIIVNNNILPVLRPELDEALAAKTNVVESSQ